ncbi:odorant receptor 4-like isoform X2 [Rhynchophorus ferrugineus]|uniref:odorant receptor 4-like isoform X2 n=1 Tax=Rhynchophorus ferrugineus TaxID=354439 RepID=UPI003FCEDD3C
MFCQRFRHRGGCYLSKDPYIIWETTIGVSDYLGFVYVSVCFRMKLNRLRKALRGIDVFLDYCDASVIRAAEAEVNFYTKCFVGYFLIGLFLNGLVPILGRHSCNERRVSDFYRKHDPCGMPVRNLYPFDATDPLVFAVVYAVEAFTCFLVCFGILGITMTLIGFLIHIIAQITNCKKHILQIFEDNDDPGHDEEKVRERMTFCINYHRTIISYTESVYAVFNLVLIIHISVTSLIFGVTLYLITKVETYADKSRYSLQLAGWIALLFITCYYGQRIITESVTIADAAYQSLWYNGPVSLQKNVKLMIMRGQRPLKLNVASIGVISLETFVGVMKTAYSFFALLITISD